MTHPYDPMCPCADCCRHERAAELQQEQLNAAMQRLKAMPAVVAEVAMNDEEAAAVAQALVDGDTAEAGRVFELALSRYVAELLEARENQFDLSPLEAAEQLCAVYGPAVNDPILRGNADLVSEHGSLGRAA